MLYATNLSNDVAPTELPRFLVRHCYKDLAPTEPWPRMDQRKAALQLSDRVGLASEAALQSPLTKRLILTDRLSTLFDS
jgi:hypothetical protein